MLWGELAWVLVRRVCPVVLLGFASWDVGGLCLDWLRFTDSEIVVFHLLSSFHLTLSKEKDSEL